LPRFEGNPLVMTTVASGNGGTGRVMKICDPGVQLQEALRPLSCPEASLLLGQNGLSARTNSLEQAWPPHEDACPLTFLPPCRSVGLLDYVVAAGCRNHLNVLHRVEHGKPAQGRTITPELIGVNDLRHVVFPQQPVEERPGGLGIPVFL
jgi:hypothetical protein